MSERKYHLGEQPIPEGFEIFEERLDVAGIRFRKDDARAFIESSGGWLEFERDAANVHDSNAIRILGCTKGLIFGTTRRFLGYVQSEVAKAIIQGGYWGQVQPRLLKTWVGDTGFVEIVFQLLGPKGKKYEIRQAIRPVGRHYTDWVDQVMQLTRDERFDEAIQLLLKAVNATEKEAKKDGGGVAPWYYEKLATIYRKQRRYDDEVAILERFEQQPKSAGIGPAKLAERLVRARKLRAGRASSN
jgi:hypothetical protein